MRPRAGAPGPRRKAAPRRELRALRERNRDVHVMLYPKRGADLARELKWLGSYRYAACNLGGTTLDELFSRFHRLHSQIDFHPRGHEMPAMDLPLAPGDD